MQRASFADLPDRIVENIVLAVGLDSLRALARTSRGLRRACAAARWPSVRLSARNEEWIQDEIDGGRFGRIGRLEVRHTVRPRDAARVARATGATSVHLEVAVGKLGAGAALADALVRFARAGLRVPRLYVVGDEGGGDDDDDDADPDPERVARAAGAVGVEYVGIAGAASWDGIGWIARAFPAARFLALYLVAPGDETVAVSLAPAAEMPALEALWASGCDPDGGVVFERPRAGAALRTLCASSVFVDDEDVRALARSASLRTLQLSLSPDRPVPDLGLLARLRGLERCALEIPSEPRPGIASELARGLAAVPVVRLGVLEGLARAVLESALVPRLASIWVENVGGPRGMVRVLDQLAAAEDFRGRVLLGAFRFPGTPWAEEDAAAILAEAGGAVARLRARGARAYLMSFDDDAHGRPINAAALGAGIGLYPEEKGSLAASTGLLELEVAARRMARSPERCWFEDNAPDPVDGIDALYVYA